MPIADEPGQVITTLHDFVTSVVSAASLGVSPDGRYLYWIDTNTHAIGRIDTTTWTIQNPWYSDSFVYFTALAVGSDGTIYVAVAYGSGVEPQVAVDRINPDTGLRINPREWARIPPGDRNITGMTFGRDGNLYVHTPHSFGIGDAESIYKVTPAGAVSLVYQANIGSFIGSWLAVDSHGAIWTVLNMFDSTLDNVLRRYRQVQGDTVDFNIDPDPGGFDPHPVPGGLVCDSEDHVCFMAVTVAGQVPTGHIMRVTPDGTPTRIAGTWSHTGNPPPQTTATDIADGGLGTNLLSAVTALGISQDGVTLFFIDSSDAVQSHANNLVRSTGKSGKSGLFQWNWAFAT